MPSTISDKNQFYADSPPASPQIRRHVSPDAILESFACPANPDASCIGCQCALFKRGRLIAGDNRRSHIMERVELLCTHQHGGMIGEVESPSPALVRSVTRATDAEWRRCVGEVEEPPVALSAIREQQYVTCAPSPFNAEGTRFFDRVVKITNGVLTTAKFQYRWDADGGLEVNVWPDRADFMPCKGRALYTVNGARIVPEGTVNRGE